MNERQSQLLIAIIDQFIGTAVPVGSKELQRSSHFSLSGATIRNEMRVLGNEGFLMQPHISAGRVPTAKGYQLYVRQMPPTPEEKAIRAQFDDLRQRYFQRKDQERAYEAVMLLSQMMPNVAFATVPYKERVYYMGLANTLRQPEFIENPALATGVVEVLETRLSDLIDQVIVDEQVRYYIGEEHLLPQIQSCSIMVTGYKLRDFQGVLGIIGPMRMDYAYNTTALDLVAGLLRDS